MSTIHHDDPRLTAYALGELDAAERAAIAAGLDGDAATLAEVERIRALSRALGSALGAEAAHAPALTKPQRVAISRAVPPAAPVVGATRGRHSAWWWSIGSAAAAATIAVMVLPTMGVVREMARPLALRMETGTTAPAQADSPAAAPVRLQPVVGIPPAPVPGVTAAAPPQPAVVEAAPVTLAAVEDERAFDADSADHREAHVPTGRFENRSAPVAPGDAGRLRLVDPKLASSSTPPAMVVAPAAKSAPVAADRYDPPQPQTTSASRQVVPPIAPVPPAIDGGETYNQRADHGFSPAREAPLSTFGLDVDTASYGNVRRMIESGRLPPRDAVRVEELVNYFPYSDIPEPEDGEAFGLVVEVAPCPWQPAHKLARIAVRGKAVAVTVRPRLNLVFLIDVSGSMKPDNRLPLIKTGLSMLANQLAADDLVTIVTYAGSAQVTLPSTPGSDQRTILRAIDRMAADGSTNGGSGIQLAYDAARAGFRRGGINRVILCTDGDFNVGVTNRDELVRLAQARAAEGIFLTVLGVGQDNLKDATMELLADKANGHYHYLDTIAEARKVLVEQMNGTLMTIAKDAKAQVEFNPARIAAWRQLGYEKRQLAAKDFADDRKDGGEIGAGHQVTMLYELVPVGVANAVVGEGLRYQPGTVPAAPGQEVHNDELLTVKLRYKQPDGSTSRLVQGTVTDAQVRQAPSTEQRFAGMVAAFALHLRGAEGMGLQLPAIASEARRAIGSDPQGYRREFVELVQRAMGLEGHPVQRE
jgi:Ca-activated chloride channel family protein